MLCNCNSQIQYRFQASDVTVFQAKYNTDSGKTRLFLAILLHKTVSVGKDRLSRIGPFLHYDDLKMANLRLDLYLRFRRSEKSCGSEDTNSITFGENRKTLTFC